MNDAPAYLRRPSPVRKELFHLFPQDAVITIFDVGSCDGLDAIRYGKMFPQSTIYAFEPVPDNFKITRAHIAEFGDDRVHAFELAMSDQKGATEMFLSSAKYENQSSSVDAGNKSSSLLPPDQHLVAFPWCAFEQKETVQTETIENFCRDHGISFVHFLHLDVQGAELMVLQGAGDRIRHILSVWIEVGEVSLYKDQPLRRDVEKFMIDRGFILCKFRVGRYSGDQFYVSKELFRNMSGHVPIQYQLRSWFLRSGLFTAVHTLLRKTRFAFRRG